MASHVYLPGPVPLHALDLFLLCVLFLRHSLLMQAESEREAAVQKFEEISKLARTEVRFVR